MEQNLGELIDKRTCPSGAETQGTVVQGMTLPNPDPLSVEGAVGPVSDGRFDKSAAIDRMPRGLSLHRHSSRPLQGSENM
jgi:hypothetical protein